MNRIGKKTLLGLSALLIAMSAVIPFCYGEQPGHGELKTVDNPGGGQFVYGPLTGQKSKTDALVYMLHMVHQHFGAKPQVGKFLQSHDGSSLATFFTLNAATLGGRPMEGLVIISMQAAGSPQAAVLYDNAGNFVNSEPSMMRALTSAWQGTSAGGAGSPDRSQGAVSGGQNGPEKIFPATAGDRSAQISLPPGWKINGVAGGQLVAEGAHGEMLTMGMIYQNIINPQAQGANQLLSGGMASRGPKVVCPMGPDLFNDYVCVINQVRRNNGKSQGSFHFIRALPQQGNGDVIPPIVAIFTVDFNDGMGSRKGSARLGVMATRGYPSWAMTVSMSNIPESYEAQGNSTLKAVVESYRQNAQVISAEAQADMERIRQQGLRNEEQTKAIDARRESNKQGFENHMNTLDANDRANDAHNAELDWQSKINQNYILDRSVVRDSDDTVHATMGNKLADALVRSNPTQLEYVPNQQLIQGVDY